MKALALDVDNPARQEHRIGGRAVPIPREHGGWGMFLTGAALGAAVSALNVPGLLFFAAALGFYALREPLFLIFARSSAKTSAGRTSRIIGTDRARLKGWAWIFAATAVVPAVLLLFLQQRWLLLPLGLVGAASLATDIILRRGRRERTAAGELLGIAQVTLVTPGMVYAATGRLEKAAFLWLLTILYYAGSVPYVKLKLAHLLKRPASAGLKLRLGVPALLYQVLAVAAAAALAREGWIPPLAPLAFIPNAVKVVYGVADVPPRVEFKQVGWTEVATATAFAVILILAYRL